MIKAPRLRGLVVSDDPVLRLALGVILGRCGFEVAAEVDGAARAVAAARLLRPEAVVIDAALSGFGGLAEVVPAIRAASDGCSVLVLASPVFSGLRDRARQVGALDLFELSDLRPLERRLHGVGVISPGCDCWRSGRPPPADPVPSSAS